MTSFRSEVPSPVRPSDGGVRGGPITPEMVSKLLDDRPDDGIFRVDRTVFTDQDIFERELTHVFEGLGFSSGWKVSYASRMTS